MPPKRFTHLLSRYCKTAKNINMWVYVSTYHTLTHTHSHSSCSLFPCFSRFYPYINACVCIPTWTSMSLYEQMATKSWKTVCSSHVQWFFSQKEIYSDIDSIFWKQFSHQRKSLLVTISAWTLSWRTAWTWLCLFWCLLQLNSGCKAGNLI